MAREDDLLKEIRENFDYDMAQWREIREEARKDAMCLTMGPWSDQERKEREGRRPCLSLDELSQYVNQTVNDVRQNKRAIKVVPKGDGANDKTAELRGNLIRQIEYKSNAQTAYLTAYQSMVERSYGYFRIATRYVGPDSFDQELCIKRIPNPDSVLPDYDAKEIDFSDAGHFFVLDTLKTTAFEKRWPKAEQKDFTGATAELAPAWIKEDRIQIAEYWRVETRRRTLLLLGTPQGEVKLFEDELPKGAAIRTLQRRPVEDRTVVQYITNGVEILERNPWIGHWIPIVPVLGKEIFLDQGAGSKRLLFSLIRMARDPYMLYCYYRTCEAELVGMTPKVPFIGAEGQFENHEQDWANVNKVPLGYLEYKAVLDSAPGQMLPPPARPNFAPAIEPLELGAESAKRAIQSAMGRYNASVGKSDSQVKSGVAIKALDTQSDQGSFHFIDNFDRALEHAGRILDDLLDKVYVGTREVGIRKPDDTYSVVKLNEPHTDANGQPQHFPMDQGDHDVTIGVGPSYQDQREQADEFVDVLVANLATLPLDPQTKAHLLALSIKLKNLGPLGDQMAEIISPQQNGQIPPQAQAALAQLQAENQQLKVVAQGLLQERQAKLLELHSKLAVAEMQQQTAITVQGMKSDLQSSLELLRAEMTSIEQRLNMLHESELAPNPGSGPQGIHPDGAIPAGQNGTAGANAETSA